MTVAALTVGRGGVDAIGGVHGNGGMVKHRVVAGGVPDGAGR